MHHHRKYIVSMSENRWNATCQNNSNMLWRYPQQFSVDLVTCQYVKKSYSDPRSFRNSSVLVLKSVMSKLYDLNCEYIDINIKGKVCVARELHFSLLKLVHICTLYNKQILWRNKNTSSKSLQNNRQNLLCLTHIVILSHF